MLHGRNKNMPMTIARAEEIAANALAFLAADVDRLSRFLSVTGLSPDELRRDASNPSLWTAVLDHLIDDESLLLVFAATAGLPPAEVAPARDALSREAPLRNDP